MFRDCEGHQGFMLNYQLSPLYGLPATPFPVHLDPRALVKDVSARKECNLYPLGT